MQNSVHRYLKARQPDEGYPYETLLQNKKLYRAFSRQANGLTLNIPVLQGLLRVNSKAEKDA